MPINFPTTKLFIFVNGSFTNNKDFSSQLGYKIIITNKSTGENDFIIYNNLIYQSLIKNKYIEQSLIKTVHLLEKTLIQGKNVILSWFLVLSSNKQIKGSLRLIDKNNISFINVLLYIFLLQRININNINLFTLIFLAQSNGILVQGEDVSIKK